MDPASNHQLDFSSLVHDEEVTTKPTLATLSEMATPPAMSIGQLRIEAQHLSRNIFANHHTLQAILARHETIIQKRWAKKKKQQKLEILEEIWPGMAKTHRPDFALWRRKGTLPQTEAQAQSQRKHFLCPYINQEDLIKPNALLLLLKSRGRQAPACFAAADCEAMHFGRVTQSLKPIFLNSYTMILNGTNDLNEYGKLVSWEDVEDAFTWYTDGTQFMPGEGLLVLEVQNLVMDFLVAFCNKILHDIRADLLLSDAYPVEPEPLIKSEKEVNGFESMATVALETPYRVPARLDIERIESLLRARMKSADDHIWQLREDPGYFIEQLHEVMEHRQEMLKDTNGQAHPAHSSTFQNILWTRILGELLVNAYLGFEIFAELHKQAIHLQTLYSKYETAIHPEQSLPEELLMAILKLRYYLHQAARGHYSQLKQSVVASPPMRRFFVRTPPVDRTSSKIQVRSKPGAKREKYENELVWLLQTLWEDGHDLFLMRMPFVLDELERLLAAEPQAKNLVSAGIASQVGSLSIISQCVQQLELYQPWARGYEDALAHRQGELKIEYAKITAPWSIFMQALGEKNRKLRQVAEPCESLGNFTYPSAKRRTKETIEAMIAAERNLDQLWVRIDELVLADAGGLEGMAVKQVLSRPLPIQRTSYWIEPASIERGQSMAINPEAISLYKPLSTLYIGHDTETSETSAEVSQKSKTKTRGRASQPPAVLTTPFSKPFVEPNAELIKVDARAFKVFRTLFYDPAITSTPGEVSWGDFIHALASTGKFTVEKLYGSVWQFAMIDGLGQRKILFHEPHPHGKIPFVVARRHGRRLSRSYGWTRGTFALE